MYADPAYSSEDAQQRLQYDDKPFDYHLDEHRTSQEIGVSRLVDNRQLNFVAYADLPNREGLGLGPRMIVRPPLALLFSREASDGMKIETLNRLFLGQGGGDSHHVRTAMRVEISMS